MSDIAQVDRIISEVNNLDEKGKIVFFQKIGQLLESTDTHRQEEITMESAFGLWKDRAITKETLRAKAWKQP